MKTEAQFNLLVKVYRTEVRWRGVLFFPFVVVTASFILALGSLLEHFTGNRGGLSLMGISLLVLTVFGLNRYFKASKESLARKLDLVCPHCSHVLRPDDSHLSATANQCPWCRNQFFS